MTSALIIGEALVDVVRREDGPPQAHPGGSPLNVAVGLARLGIPTTLHSAFGDDAHGVAIAEHVRESGVEVTATTVGREPTSIAEAAIGRDGAATYDFRIAWDPAAVDTAGFDLVHTGSIGAALEPGATVVERALAAAPGLVSFDPNVRPALMPEREVARERVERIVALSDIVKASDEDLAWLYPDTPTDEVLARWLERGPRLVVVTRGKDGADAVTEGGPLHVAVPSTTVVDTIGAGDSFMAGLLAHVLENGFEDVSQSLHFAARCAAVTVSRAGANPPWRREVGPL